MTVTPGSMPSWLCAAVLCRCLLLIVYLTILKIWNIVIRAYNQNSEHLCVKQSKFVLANQLME